MTSSFDLRPLENRDTSQRTDSDASVGIRSGIVVEGMPGAGKTTALAALAGQGLVVLGEYTDGDAQAIDLARHPHHDDEHPHLANWLRKDSQARRPTGDGSVIMDRNWLTALAWAASVGGLPDRATWVHEHLTAGRLTLPERWIILDCSVMTSLKRRRDRLDPGHPWTDPGSLHRLRAFYSDPAATIAPVLPDLAELIGSVPAVRVDAEPSKGVVGRAIGEAVL